jgi:hypothetical protein
MKKLQSNFTTPKQSKQLLELGVPEWTADCYYTQESIEGSMYWFKILLKRECQPDPSLHARVNIHTTLPCWSVGRLIEIYEIIGENAGQCVSTTKSTSRIESLVQLYEENATLLDFSKLEE